MTQTPNLPARTAWLALFALSGCMVGPDYHRPAAPTPAAYKEIAGWTPAQPSDAADRKDWWTVFGDSVLNDLEAKVAISNQTLAAAEAGYRQARALVAQQRAALLPTITLTGSASRTGGGTSPTSHAYGLNLGGSWEPDLWGRIRRTVENARASAQASAADLANARLSAQTELAVDYVQLRQLDEEKRILDATVAAYRRTLEITRHKYDAGVSARGDVLSAESQLSATRADAVDLAQQRARLEHAIAILTGAPPADVSLPPAPWTLVPPAIPPGLPTTLLQRRPDIAAAERSAAAANALIGVQIAAYYPNLTLTGQGGYQGADIGALFSPTTSAWSLGATAAETVFNGGERRAAVKAARAAYDQAVANYRQTVLTAFGQVEDDLAAQTVLSAEQALRREARDAAAQAEVIARNQYAAGQVDYTAVVVAQTAALTARNSDLQIEGARLTTAIDLIAALGGGWSAEDARSRPPGSGS